MYLAVLFPEPEWESWLWFSQKKKTPPKTVVGVGEKTRQWVGRTQADRS